MPTLLMPPDMAEAFDLFREERPTPAVVRRESGPPVQYFQGPFRKYVPPPRPEPEPEDPRRIRWRERFENAGLRIAVAPYMDLDGPRWYARLEGKAFGRRNLAVCLDRGIWSDQLLRDRPFDELLEHVDRLNAGNPVIALPQSDKPAPPPTAPDPPDVLFERECVRRGFELQGGLLPNGCRCGTYRGLWVAIFPAGQTVQVGVRTPEGRAYSHYRLPEALRLMDAELRPKTSSTGKPAGTLF